MRKWGMVPTLFGLDGGYGARLAATHKEARKLFSFDQFQIALPLNRIGIMLRANRHPNRWMSADTKFCPKVSGRRKRPQRRKGREMPNLNINGRNMSVEAANDTPLLWVIREQLQMTGTKFGCGAG